MADISPEFYERLGAIGQEAKSAHARITEVKNILVEVSEDVKELRRNADTDKGWKAGAMWVGGIAGAASAALLSFLLK